MKRLLYSVLVLLAVACGENVPRELAELGAVPLLSGHVDDEWAHPLDSAPDGGCQRMKFPGLVSIGRLFNDSNHVHLAAAEAAGITPVTDLRSVWHNARGLVEIRSCREYYLAPLSHSYPYLVPDAADLLREIGARFADSLAARGGGAYRPKVTSVLRTPATVGKLRRVNRNATENCGKKSKNYSPWFIVFFFFTALCSKHSFSPFKRFYYKLLFPVVVNFADVIVSSRVSRRSCIFLRSSSLSRVI